MLCKKRFAGAVVLTASLLCARASAEMVPLDPPRDVQDVAADVQSHDSSMRRTELDLADVKVIASETPKETAPMTIAAKLAAPKLAAPVMTPVSSVGHATTAAAPAMIPLPPAVWTGLIGLGALAALSATRKFRHML